jgi:hypothetical protein
MMGWIVAGTLYVIAGFGMYAMACDVNAGPIKTTWKRWAFTVWPLVIVTQAAGDLWDHAKGESPYWLQRRR